MATAARAGERIDGPSPIAPGGLASGEDFANPPGRGNTVITIGPADSQVVQDNAEAGGVRLLDDGNGNTVVDFNPEAPKLATAPGGFDANLAESLDDAALMAIATEVFEGIQADEQSRRLQIETYKSCMDMMALKIESRGQAGPDGQSVSQVRHPILLEAVTLFQAAAGAEMLPAAGPVKVQNEGGDTLPEDSVAMALERDMNWYLTKVATEYYPGTDRANFYLGYGGTIFKKVYKCPLRRRPVSEPVYIPDLIVSNDATDLQNAQRITHVLPYTRAEVKRMVNMRIWRKIDLSPPISDPATTKLKEGEISGVSPLINRIPDIPRIIYECYTELWLPEYGGQREKGQPQGLPVPYRVTMDKVSRRILEIRRDWKRGDEMFMRKKHFIKFGLVPGFGFYDLGYLHLLGNQTKVLTAIWRILCDAGMFSNFPGGVMIQGVRTQTNLIRPNPGEYFPIQTGPQQDVSKAFQPLPYKEPSAVLLQLAQMLTGETQKLANTVQIETGEGRTNIPVGTIMAQIEQQTQVMQAVHKRLHRAQSEEFELLLDLFREDPTMLWKFFGDKEPQRQWMTAQEFSNIHLRAASDPNIPAQVHRIMLAVALTMLAQQAPALYDLQALNMRVLQMINVNNPQELMMTPEKQAAQSAGQPPPPPDPKVQAAQINAASKQQSMQQEAQTHVLDMQSKGMEAKTDLQTKQMETGDREAERQNRLAVAHIKEQGASMRDAATKEADAARLSLDHAVEDHKAFKLHHDAEMDRQGLAADRDQAAMDHQLGHATLAHEQQKSAREHALGQAGLAHEAQQAEREHAIAQAGVANEQEKTAQQGLQAAQGLAGGQP